MNRLHGQSGGNYEFVLDINVPVGLGSSARVITVLGATPSPSPVLATLPLRYLPHHLHPASAARIPIPHGVEQTQARALRAAARRKDRA